RNRVERNCDLQSVRMVRQAKVGAGDNQVEPLGHMATLTTKVDQSGSALALSTNPPRDRSKASSCRDDPTSPGRAEQGATGSPNTQPTCTEHPVGQTSQDVKL